MRRAGLLAALFVLMGAVLAGPVSAKAAPFPDFTAPVVDTAGVVPADVQSRVDAALEDYQRRSGNQIAVAVVKTTGDASLENWSIDLARKWGVGTKSKDNGVLLLIAYDDHRVRIETGSKVDDRLTDLEAGRIIADRLIPLLKAGSVGAAVEQGVDAIRQQLGDPDVGPLPPTTAPEPTQPGTGGAPLWVFLPLALVAFGVFGGIGRRRGRFGGGFGGPMIWGGGFGGGGFGGGGGGGFGGGGGGGFSGGGASGGW